jgi:hypothetical protein
MRSRQILVRLLPREPTEDFCAISGVFNVSKKASHLDDEVGLIR